MAALDSGRAGGFRSNRCCGCRCRCAGAVREAEGTPMVEVDLIRAEDQIDAGAQIGEDWLEGQEVGRESEGLKQIRFCLSRRVDECR